jgi:DNA-binding CsgD family transcriptional regulator
VALASSGYCSQAIDVLDTISIHRHEELMIDYYSAYEWIYGAWEEFGPIFSQEYHSRRAEYLDSLVNILPKGGAQYNYYLAERALSSHDYKQAIKFYNTALKQASPSNHLYAKASYALATIYKTLGDDDRYEEHLIRAAITDQLVPAKENLALQELALYLKNQYGDVVHANAYLRYAIEDAVFFNSRLRMDGVASKFPQIVVDYQDRVEIQKRRLGQYAFWLSVLAVGITITLLILIWQYRQLKRSRCEISEMNSELRELNRRLLSTNKFRDQYLTLFMELSASYVEKYNSFRSLVRLKLKAKQYDDLLRISSRSRTADSESRETFFSFDYAFLRIYPDFVKEFNALLRPDMQIELRPNEILTTELRIFALIRMGITDSAKIATMLQYSPQTIYNYRTSVRNRAVNRDTFEAEVMRLCTVIPEDEEPGNAQKLAKTAENVENNSTNGEI